MKNTDGANTPTLREFGYAFLTIEENQEVHFQILRQLGLVWIDNEHQEEHQGEV